MQKLPPSYLDKKVTEKIHGTEVKIGNETLKLGISTFPQARNGIPNPDYDNGDGFVPQGAVSNDPVQHGEMCQGNANCVPICPVQAKYDARKTLIKSFRTGRVHLLSQAVAYQIEIDPENGRVTTIQYKHYDDANSPKYTTGIARGTLFVLAANAIENARLMLASALPNTSGMIGCHLMDHPFMLAWALMPEVVGTLRGRW